MENQDAVSTGENGEAEVCFKTRTEDTFVKIRTGVLIITQGPENLSSARVATWGRSILAKTVRITPARRRQLPRMSVNTVHPPARPRFLFRHRRSRRNHRRPSGPRQAHRTHQHAEITNPTPIPGIHRLSRRRSGPLPRRQAPSNPLITRRRLRPPFIQPPRPLRHTCEPMAHLADLAGRGKPTNRVKACRRARDQTMMRLETMMRVAKPRLASGIRGERWSRGMVRSIGILWGAESEPSAADGRSPPAP